MRKSIYILLSCWKYIMYLGVSKKTEKPRKLRKPEKKITEKTEQWKKSD
jgi:hypothetical protein